MCLKGSSYKLHGGGGFKTGITSHDRVLEISVNIPAKTCILSSDVYSVRAVKVVSMYMVV